MHQAAPPPYLFVLFPLYFAGLWCVVCMLLSWVSGWSRLARSFLATGKPSGRRFSWKSGLVGIVSYRGCLNLHTSPEGIHISVWPLFRLGHPPLFIPWSALRNARRRRFLWTDSVAFEVGSPKIATLNLPPEVFEGHNIV